MQENDILVRCCRCNNRHNESERILKPRRDEQSIRESTCPRCGARSYFDLRPMVAYCWASGLIEFGESVPDDAIKIAHGPKADLKCCVEVLARQGKGSSAGKLLVPGIPEASDQRAAGDALAAFIDWASKSRLARKNGVVFTSVGGV